METTLATPPKKLDSFRLSANAIKLIAIIAMLIDHTASIFIPSSHPIYSVMRMIGRITGPVMFFFAVEGYHHTRNLAKYLLRLFLFGLISYLPYIYYFSGGLPHGNTFFDLNVLFTILAGLLAVHARRHIKQPIWRVLVIALLIGVSVWMDWGITGVLMILSFDMFYGNFKQQCFGHLLIILFDLGLVYVVTAPFQALVAGLPLFSYSHDTLITLGHLLPLGLLALYNGKKGGGGAVSKWSFYIFYPLHIVLLRLLYTAVTAIWPSL